MSGAGAPAPLPRPAAPRGRTSRAVSRATAPAANPGQPLPALPPLTRGRPPGSGLPPSRSPGPPPGPAAPSDRLPWGRCRRCCSRLRRENCPEAENPAQSWRFRAGGRAGGGGAGEGVPERGPPRAGTAPGGRGPSSRGYSGTPARPRGSAAGAGLCPPRQWEQPPEPGGLRENTGCSPRAFGGHRKLGQIAARGLRRLKDLEGFATCCHKTFLFLW